MVRVQRVQPENWILEVKVPIQEVVLASSEGSNNVDLICDIDSLKDLNVITVDYN